MYRCKECGTEYELKPEYCDCGNDTFEEILPAEPQKNVNEVPINKNESEMWVEESGFGYPINEKTYNEFKKETASKNSSAIQPYAIVTFVACIILSLLIILFAFNPKNFDDKKTEIGKKDTTSQNLPTIENIWNNSTDGISTYQNDFKEKITNDTPKITKTESTKENISKKKVEDKKLTTKETKKVTPQKNNTKLQTNEKKSTKTEQKTSTQTTHKVVETKLNPQELENYKIKLRNNIASKIAFTSVVGDGTCSFSFKVSGNGILTNKAPVKLSENDSLNEAVYNALKQTYSFSNPPSGYKQETLKLTVKMYNNSFEVHLN